MPSIQFGTSSYQRSRGNLPSLPVINMFVEKADPETKGIALQSRPGLEETGTDLGTSAVEALFQKDGVLSGAQFAIGDYKLFESGSSLGSIDGAGPYFIDGYEDFLFAAGGGGLWGYDGSTLSEVAFPDGAQVTKVVVGASRAICLRADTETFYWSDTLTSTIDSLSFATAESQPDRLRDMLFIDDALILFGAETVEFWPNTQDNDLPFQPLEGRVFEVGVKKTGAATAFGPSFAWVTNHGRVCVGDESTVVSNEGLEAKILASSQCRLFTFPIDASEFLALRLDEETHVYSQRYGRWSEFQSHDEDNWVPQCQANGVFGSAIDGRMLRFGSDWTDMGGVLERRFRCGAPLDSGELTVFNLVLRSNVGTTTYLTGDYANPRVELRVSRNAGKTWGNWKDKRLGEQGDYRKKVHWPALGMFGQPGMMGEIRVTDPVDWRVSDVLINEPFGGL
jgi:hypothetical protein